MVVCRLLTASAMLLLSVPARAARPHSAIALDYVPSVATAARCPSADFLREEVQIRIGYDLFQTAASPRLTVKIDQARGEFRVTGELRSKPGDITFASSFTEVECSAAIRSLAIAVAIHFTRTPEACALAPPPTQASAALAPPVVPKAPRSPVLPERPRVQIGIASVLSVGSAPIVTGGAAWLVGVRWASFSASLEGQALFAPAASLAGPRFQRGYRFLVAAVTASGCAHPAWAFACFQVQWGSLSFGNSAVDVDPNHLSRLGLSFRFGGERALTRAVALRAYLETLFNPSPGNLRSLTASSRVIWHEPIFSGSLGLGPVITF